MNCFDAPEINDVRVVRTEKIPIQFLFYFTKRERMHMLLSVTSDNKSVVAACLKANNVIAVDRIFFRMVRDKQDTENHVVRENEF